MRILALEHELPNATIEQFYRCAVPEARALWDLYQAGVICESYFHADRTEAVLVLEGPSVEEAREALSALPFVQNKLITFELIPLKDCSINTEYLSTRIPQTPPKTGEFFVPDDYDEQERNPTMKRIFLFLSLFIIVTLACDVSVNILPTNTVPTAAGTPVLIDPPTPTPEIFISLTQAIPATPVVQPTPVTNTLVTFGRLTLEIPSSVASGANGSDIAPVTNEDAAYWQKTPGHVQVSLGDYYVLQGKFHQPQIYVYPAMPYVELVPAAFESMHRLRNVMNQVAPITADQLPAVPFFNAAQVFASNIQAVTFQNGSGVRFLTEYAQYPAPVNNHELVYHFQGFSSDGEYYIVAIFPIAAPVLAETGDAGSPLPSGGIPYPSFDDPDPQALQKYYGDVATILDAASPDAFTPSFNQLDALIQSMWVAP